MSKSNKKSNIPSEEQLLNALDTEIAYIKSEQQRPGWTIWAILGGLAVIVWHLLLAWENGFSTTINVVSWFLVFTLLSDTIILFKSSVSSEESQRKFGTRYYFLQQRYSEERLAMFLLFILYTVLIVIAIKLSTAVKWYYTYTAYLYLGFVMLLVLGILVTSFLRVPVAERELTWHAKVLLLFLLLMAALSTFGYVNYLTLTFKSVQFSDIRMGILLWAASFLLIKLTQLGKKSALLLSLIEIRRDLGFRRMDVESALQSADIALAGMRLTNVVQDDVRELIKLLENIDDESRIISTRYDMAMSQLPTKKEDLTKEQRELISTVIDSCQEHLKKENELIEQYNEKSEQFMKRIFRLSSKEDPEYNKILDKIKVVKEKTTQRTAENAKKSDKLIKWFE